MPPNGGATSDAGSASDGKAAWTQDVPVLSGRMELTKREREIITLISAGIPTAGIAERLFLSPETIKSHVGNTLGKLGAHTRAHAVAIALVTGQIAWETQRHGDADGATGPDSPHLH
jgi:DNA-binding CsgD family transcriptional regulator